MEAERANWVPLRPGTRPCACVSSLHPLWPPSRGVCSNCSPASLELVGHDSQGWRLSGKNDLEKGEPGASKRWIEQVRCLEGDLRIGAAFSPSVKQALMVVVIVGRPREGEEF